MLSFVLHHGTEPLVLDQPEDDLDVAGEYIREAGAELIQVWWNLGVGAMSLVAGTERAQLAHFATAGAS
jgi:hypothetical protein